MSEKVIAGPVHIENYGPAVRMSFPGFTDLLVFLSREEAKQIAEVLERFARTGKVNEVRNE